MKFFSKSTPEPENAAPTDAAPDAAPDAATSPASAPPSSVEVDLEAAIPIENDEPEIAEVTLETPIEAEIEQLESTLEPPRPLAPGAFLGGDLEIIEVVSRGQINLYRADIDEWGSHDYQLVAERHAPATFIENPPDAPLFPPARRWTQDGLEYAAWPLQPLTQLADWQPPANDEVYLQTLATIAAGLSALEEAELAPVLPRDALWIDIAGEAKFYGFFDAKGDAAPAMSALEQLSALSSQLAKRNLARGATLKLDDEFSALPLSDETKTFAKKLAAGEWETIGEAANWLRIAPVHNTEIALLSDVGMEREVNEDCGLTLRLSRAGHALNVEVEVVAVADGMGGHEGGEVASELTLSTLQNELLKLDINWSDNAAVIQTVGEICERVNAAVVAMNENPPYAAMRHKPGATLVVGNSAWQSRFYRQCRRQPRLSLERARRFAAPDKRSFLRSRFNRQRPFEGGRGVGPSRRFGDYQSHWHGARNAARHVFASGAAGRQTVFSQRWRCGYVARRKHRNYRGGSSHAARTVRRFGRGEQRCGRRR